MRIICRALQGKLFSLDGVSFFNEPVPLPEVPGAFEVLKDLELGPSPLPSTYSNLFFLPVMLDTGFFINPFSFFGEGTLFHNFYSVRAGGTPYFYHRYLQGDNFVVSQIKLVELLGQELCPLKD